MTTDAASPAVRSADQAFRSELTALQVQTDHVLKWLLLGQWVFVVACAAWVSPRTWEGAWSATHAHVWAALGLGGALVSLPWLLVTLAPGARSTRMVIAAAEAGFSALIIHVFGGRIEAHFHIFGMLALLSFYRDPLVYLPAVAVTVADHLTRGLFWPESVFGVSTPSALRALEHGGWVVFEVVFLLWGVAQSRRHLYNMATLQASLQEERDQLESRVRRRTAQLEDSKRYVESVLDSLDARICILDKRGVIISTNRAWQELASLGACEPTSLRPGLNYVEACRDCGRVGRPDLSELADAVTDVIGDDQASHIQEFRTEAHGEVHWLQVRVSPFCGGDAAAAVVAHVDVTDRVEATERSLEESRRSAALSRILRESPNEVYIVDQESLRFAEVNEGAERKSGFSRDDLLEMTPADLLPDVDQESLEKILAPLAAGERCVALQKEMVTRAGERYPVHASVHSAELDGRPVYVAFVTDLTHTRALEHQLAQAQKLESLGQLAAGIAHEINTPMQCIASNMEFLDGSNRLLEPILRAVVDTLGEDEAEWPDARGRLADMVDRRVEFVMGQTTTAIEETAGASRRVVEIVAAMKAMSHPGSREKSVADLNEMIDQAATISRNRWKHVAEMKLDLGAEVVAPVLTAELSQVLLNLIVNAADAITERHGEGGGGEIGVSTSDQGEYVRIEVSDNGAGMTEEVRSKIFQPFFTTKDVGKGTGQGLAIAHDVVVNRHGGLIEVASTRGEGTTFIVSLPSQEAPRGAAETDADHEDEPTLTI